MCDETRIVRPSARQPADHVAQVEPLGGVGARERLVEHEERRVVHERRREAHPLAHAPRVAPQPAVLRLDEIDRLDRARDGSVDVVDTLQAGAELDELASRQEVVDRLVLGHVADPAVDARVPSHRLAEDPHRSLRGLRQAADRAEQRRLPRAVRPQKRGHPGLDDERDVAHRDDTREPLRHAVDDDRRLGHA